MKENAQTLLNRGLELHKAGQLGEAEVAYHRLLQIDPKNPRAVQYLGVLHSQRGDYRAAIDLLRYAVHLDASNYGCHANLGNALRAAGNFQAALESYDEAVTLVPQDADVRSERGQILLDLGRAADALSEFESAIKIQPTKVTSEINAGYALLALVRPSEALEHFDRAVALEPAAVAAHSNRAAALLALHRPQEALDSGQRALALDPAHTDALYNTGCALADLDQAAKARSFFKRVLEGAPTYTKARFNLGIALRRCCEYERAAACFRAVLSSDPDHARALGALVRALQGACRWDDLEVLEADLFARIARGKNLCDAQELAMICDDPQPIFRAACEDARQFAVTPLAAPRLLESQRPEKLIVGYLSGDFHDHATAHLMAQLFETHDRERFETIAFSYGPDDGSPMRQRLTQAFDRFLDITSLTDDLARDLVHRSGVHIAVDLKGLTLGGRLRILAGRCAPVQVTYLGYPGTTGAPFMDYVLADRIVIPEEDRHWYTEKVVYLPDSYQVNDRCREISAERITRLDVGIPPDAVVLCCFCASYKITPVVFSTWMRVLDATPRAVLWLLDDNADARRNLLAEAAKRGVSPDRIIFAPRLPTAHHVARYRLADLFLDTLPVNGHTTTSEALWAGLPVLTCPGRTFSGRVAASLLMAAQLPDFIAEDMTQYEAMAKSLAGSPELLSALRNRLNSCRDTCALFDTNRFRRHLERAYDMMWDRYIDGQPPSSFAVPSG